MNYRVVNINEVKSNPKNPRIIKDDKFKKLVKSIKDFPEMMEIRPIVVNTEMIVLGGNMRLKACKDAGLTKVPVILASDLTEEQQKEFIIKDNVGFGEWDWEQLKEWDTEKLDEWGLELPKFETETLEAHEDDYAVPEEIKTDIVIGDIFEIGQHRLMCGDSTIITDVEKLMNGEKADMVFTDPPYGVDFEQGKHIGRNKKGEDRNFSKILNDEKKGKDLTAFVKEALLNASIVSDVCSIYVWSAPLVEGFSILNAIIESGWHIQSQIIWNKSPFVIGRADYHWKHEVCWYGYKGKNHQWYGGRDKSTVWDVEKTKSSDSHPTMKPIKLAEIACLNSTKQNNVVLDMFLGSGSTMVAAHQLKRKCYGMELDPKYCQVIVNRMLKLDPTIEIKRNGIKYIKAE